jgi:hypothetical protein
MLSPCHPDPRFMIRWPSLRPRNIKRSWNPSPPQLALRAFSQPRTALPSPQLRTASSPQACTALLAATRSPAQRSLPTAPRCSSVDPTREAWIRPSVPQGMSDPVRKDTVGRRQLQRRRARASESAAAEGARQLLLCRRYFVYRYMPGILINY